MKQIVTGVLGYGFSGSIFHCPFIHAHESFLLKTVVQRNSHSAQKLYPYINIVKQYEDLLKDDEIELVVVTTPSNLHFEHAKMALEKGKHVLIEKPYTATYEEALELNRIADEKGLFISVYQNRRYDGDYLTIKNLIKTGELGDIYEMSMVWDRFVPVDTNTWKEGDVKSVSVVYDLGAHLLDQALSLFGQPKNFHSVSKKIRERTAITDWFSLELDYESFVVRVKASLGASYKESRYTIQTNKGAYQFHVMGEQEHQLIAGMKPDDSMYGDNAMYDIYDLEGNKTCKQVIKGNYLNYYTQMAKAIREGARPEVTKEEAAVLIKYLESV